MNRNLFKLCTAALAGSILGIVYERYPAKEGWPSLLQSVKAASGPLVARNDIRTLDRASEEYVYNLVIDPKVSAENLKHSAKFGLPSKDNIKVFNDYLLSYDRRLRAPAWVIEHLTPEKLKHRGVASRDKSKFFEDSSLHPYFRATHSDFLHSGYDRGHMAAAGNHKLSQDDLDQTFSYVNISPQQPELNRGPWERLETYVRWRAKRSKNLYVVTGPLYLPMKARDGNLYVTYRVLGNNHISVPTHYFKVFLVEENDGILSMEAFLMPNDRNMDQNVRIDDYRVPIEGLDMLERASGVIFFDQIARDQVQAPRALLNGFKENVRSETVARRIN